MTGVLPDDWEMVIGLEVHTELATETKLFCGCENRFGDDPNTNVCPTCLGLPGSLPVINERAIEYAMRLGRALHCEVKPSIFARKNYFYPDMPKDYQVSQYDLPLNVDGHIDLPDGTRIGVERAHVEEDTGKSTHMGGGGRITDAAYSLVDYNRSGVPLVEIVSRPDLRTADQAKEYASELRAILVATGVSDAKMEEGSMRVDANVSVRRGPDAEFGTRCEIKNLNSIRSLGRAIEYEARRQVDLLTSGERVIQQTRHWNEDDGRTHTLRSKEEAEDYRYFPEPDLVPLEPDPERVAEIDTSLEGVLPAQRRDALGTAAGLPANDERVLLVVDRDLDGLAIAALGHDIDAEKLLNRLVNDITPEDAAGLDPDDLAELVQLETSGELSSSQAKDVLAEMAETGKKPKDIAAEKGYEAVDTGELEALVDELIAANPDEWQRFCDGDNKVQGFFVGQIMKQTKGQADGKVVNQLLQAKKA